MQVQEIWRYPVKSMAGEPLDEAELTAEGITGDRLVFARDPGGRVVTSRTRPRLLGHRATLGPAGEPLVDGLPWAAPEVAALVEAAAGPGTRLERAGPERRFDMLPLLVATDGAVAALGEDHRRLRPNILIGGVPGLAERGWEGAWLRIGEALIGLRDLRGRCVMTTFHPDTLAQDPGVLRRILDEFGGTMALNAFVATPGRIRVGDGVALVEPPEGGWQKAPRVP